MKNTLIIIFFVSILSGCFFKDSDSNISGACVSFSGGCIDNCKISNCNQGYSFYENKTCNEVDPIGACVWRAAKECTAIRKSECHNSEFHAGEDCATACTTCNPE
jgi:hypothetical protein